jgi:EAL and modified HD-GYP domain-containing signal transduction protein
MYTATEIIRGGLDEGSSETMYIGRQPIVDAENRLCAYELLFRTAKGNHAPAMDGMHMTTEVLRSVLGMGIERVLGDSIGHINVDAAFLASDLVEALPPQLVVLEILETVVPTPELLERIRSLRHIGYRFALDDYIGELPAHAFLDEIEILKFDVALIAPERLAPLLAAVRRPGLRLLAEKIESQEMFERCRALGFELFQGYHFAQPERMQKRKPRTPQRTQLLRLVRLLATDSEHNLILEELKRHPSIAIGLLRIANSSAQGRVQPITSLGAALLSIGRQQLSRLVQAMLFLADSGVTARQNPLLQMAVARGRMMEELAAVPGVATIEEQDCAFLVGMLSLIHLVVASTLEEIVEELSLAPFISAALVQRQGCLGSLLQLIDCIEHCDDEGVAAVLRSAPALEQVDLLAHQIEAYNWARISGI